MQIFDLLDKLDAGEISLREFEESVLENELIQKFIFKIKEWHVNKYYSSVDTLNAIRDLRNMYYKKQGRLALTAQLPCFKGKSFGYLGILQKFAIRLEVYEWEK
ncbi:MAG: hypothetical protein LBB59_03350 [Campylobacteraceae bacterium]|jgi:hypothetical protein|nr:hypothetical protein [Campylobacteraceae bacterium]